MLTHDHMARFVEVPGGHLHYRTAGRGRDVALLNAGAADLRMWETTVPWLARIARVTTFDYRDTGWSSAGNEPYSEIADIAAVLDAVGVRSAVLVGVSDGARRALAFAHRHPERVDRVVVVGGTFGRFPDPTPEEAATHPEMADLYRRIAQVRAAEGVHASAAVDVAAWGSALDPDRRRMMIGMEVANSHYVTLPDEDYLGRELDPPVSTRFGEISTPISVLVGGHDLASARLWARRLTDRAPDATLTVIPGADHYPMLSAPAEFEGVLRGILVPGS